MVNNLKYNLVGISGKLGSGKDEAANSLKKFGYENKKYAYKVYFEVSVITGKPVKELQTRDCKNRKSNFQKENGEYYTYGELLQQVGTKLREVDTNIWVKALFSDYKKGYKWVISDVRFPNEVEYIKKLGGIVIRLEGDPVKINKNSKRDKKHISETALDDYFDEKDIIQNNSTIKGLHQKILNKLR